MGDALGNLIAALARLRVEMRARRRKKKRPERPSGPRPSGPNANKGCGTGAGGFGAGNTCAKEDGIPNAPRRPPALGPVSAKGDAAKAKSMKAKFQKKQAAKLAADKAKSEAYKKTPEYAQKQKQKRIDSLRRRAATKKAEKGERDAAEKQAAAESAAKKRAAMLQKIRIKKANERLNVIEKPPGRFSGEIDSTAVKKGGETQFEFAKRRADADMKKLHQELDAAETRFEARRQAVLEKIKKLEEDFSAKRDAVQNHAKPILDSGKKATAEEIKQQKMLEEAKDTASKKLAEAYRERNSIDSELAVEHHNIVSDFVKSHGKGLAEFRAEDQFYKIEELDRTTSMYAGAFRSNAKDAWNFLSKVSAPIHQEKGRSIRVRLDTKNGDADYNDVAEVARHGTRGDGDYNTSAGVIVHEIAHGLHYGPRLKAPGYPALPTVKEGIDWLQSPGYRARAAIKEDYDARIAALRSQHPQGLEQIVYGKGRENYKLWKPKGVQRQRESYLGYASQYSDAENGNETGATEVISVGVEQLYRAPRLFRKQYGSHFDITVLFLAGRLH